MRIIAAIAMRIIFLGVILLFCDFINQVVYKFTFYGKNY